MHKKFNKWLFIPIIIGLALFGALVYFFPQSPWWPQERIVIGLPYQASDPPTSMEPMGETLNHPKPQVPLGHPGIDFKWDHAAKVIASADGTVVSIGPDVENGIELHSMRVRSGKYAITYDEIGEIADGVQKGSKVYKGDVIAYVDAEFGQMHWDFGYALPIMEPLCPLTYFDDNSRSLLEKHWENAYYKARDQFPDICSGDFANRHK